MTKPGFVLTVTYPRTEGHSFNAEYYSSTHLPLAVDRWSPYVLKYEVVNFGPEAPDHVLALTYFESQETFIKAVSSPGQADVAGDVPNFTTITPVVLQGVIAASG